MLIGTRSMHLDRYPFYSFSRTIHGLKCQFDLKARRVAPATVNSHKAPYSASFIGNFGHQTPRQCNSSHTECIPMLPKLHSLHRSHSGLQTGD
ncbi:MAG: hypothetical protein CFE44_18820 [Burkholderiales bacterium PBB4]|nr:MAG: hypothetical protein CFE44_18820 [Burkholderiales bacterium PBB4]